MSSRFVSTVRRPFVHLASALALLVAQAPVAEAQVQTRFANTVDIVNGWNYETQAQGAPVGFNCNQTPQTYAVQPGAAFSVAWLTASDFPPFSLPAGSTIVDVRANILLRFDMSNSGEVDVQARVAGAWITIANNSPIPGHGTGNCVYFGWAVPAPAGGWTVTELENLQVRTRRTSNTAGSGDFRVKAFELAVTYSTPPQPPITFCDAGPCPCGNLGLPGRGCNNSWNTGGGRLDASGNSSLSNDTLMLTATSLPPSTVGFLLEGASLQAVPFGDGTNCLASFARIWNELSTGGSVQFGAFANSGPISDWSYVPATGGTRYYQVAYRDSNASFCTAETFNFTQGVTVVWVP